MTPAEMYLLFQEKGIFGVINAYSPGSWILIIGSILLIALSVFWTTMGWAAPGSNN